MTVNVCPIASINAPVEQVWLFLSEPANYALWWDAKTRSILPVGHAQAGQKIYAQTKALGKRWDVNILVNWVDDSKRQIELTTALPFGITVHNHISCTSVDNANSRVSFG
jgi:hypothetical protein